MRSVALISAMKARPFSEVDARKRKRSGLSVPSTGEVVAVGVGRGGETGRAVSKTLISEFVRPPIRYTGRCRFRPPVEGEDVWIPFERASSCCRSAPSRTDPYWRGSPTNSIV